MPRRTSRPLTHSELLARFGVPLRERAEFAAPGPDTGPRRKIHRGWSWACGCIAFLREGSDAYLLVPCARHKDIAHA